jgi:hypothetical protein
MNAKIFRTTKDEIVLVFQNANEGWQFCIFRFLTNGKIEFITTSKPNLTSEILKYLTAIFGQVSATTSVCPVSPVINLTIAEDVSKLMLKKGLVPFTYTAVDIKGVVLKDYVASIANNPNLVMTDVTKATHKGLPKRVYDSVKAWASPFLDQNNLAVYRSAIDDDLYQAKKLNTKFQLIVKYLEFVSPINYYKNILLFGPAGGGKTTTAEAIAKHFDLPYATLVCDNRMEAETVGGVITVKATDEGNSQWIQSMTNFLKVLKSAGVGVLDEASLAPGATQSALNGLINGTFRNIVWQGETHTIDREAIIFACTNEGYEGNGQLNFAFEDRFLPLFIPGPTPEEIAEYQGRRFKLPVKVTREYVNFCYKLDEYIEKHHGTDNMYSAKRPELTLRRINDMLGIMLHMGEIKTPLFEVLRGVFHSPSYSDSTINNLLNAFSNDIAKLEKVLFMNNGELVEAEEMYDRIFGLKHSPISPKPGTPSNAGRSTKSLTDMLNETIAATPAADTNNFFEQASKIYDTMVNKLTEEGDDK